jgi:ABC-type multidrug transport system ATPase subunit
MDEATRCDRIALMHRGKLLGVDTPAGISAGFGRPLVAVHASDRYKALLALRAYEHAHSVYPFGEVMHYTDGRLDMPGDRIASDVEAFLNGRGFRDVAAAPLTPTVEDTFIARTASIPEPRTPNPGKNA